jgi:hypothetical protein
LYVTRRYQAKYKLTVRLQTLSYGGIRVLPCGSRGLEKPFVERLALPGWDKTLHPHNFNKLGRDFGDRDSEMMVFVQLAVR